jgi:SAM-dependent methyltransferase
MKPTAIKSASHPVTNQVIFDSIKPLVKEGVKILDFGAGHGHMSQKIGEEALRKGIQPDQCIYPCEIVPDEFRYDKVKCQKIDTDSIIPFPDDFFDVVYAIEVLEHTPRPYDFIKEAKRVMKPSGVLILSVPNLMHVLSRFGFLLSGFATLFPPPSKHSFNAGRICGHIMPLSYPYFHYGLVKEGFGDISFFTDRKKKSCLFWALLLWPIFKLSSFIYQRNLRKYDQDVWAENKTLVPEMNSIRMLSSRSLIIRAEA